MYSGDDYSNYLTHWESALPGGKATHRLAFRNTSASEWPELFIQYFDGQEWAKQATSEFGRDNQVTMTFRVAHDVQDRYFPPAGFEWYEVSCPLMNRVGSAYC